MDLGEFRMILSKSKVDVWTLIETAITVASVDLGEELRDRRDKIVEKLYMVSSAPVCRNCESDGVAVNHKQQQKQRHRSKSPLTASTPESNHGIDDDEFGNNNEQEVEEDEELDPYGGLFDDEYTRILELKERLEDPKQSENSIVELLQTLADMDITYPVLHDTKLGKCVNKYRKHHSKAVKELVKLLVSKWRKTVDEWVKDHQDGEASADPIDDEDSPQLNIQQKFQQNGYQQGSDFKYSPNPQYGGYSSERNYSEPEQKPKPVAPREASSRPVQSMTKSVSAPSPSRPKESTIDLDQRLISARRRLHENYQEHENAKKQKKIQVMDIHEIPKPKNAFFAKNKGGFQGRHHR